MYSAKHTNVEQDCAILLLVDNVVLEDLVVQGLRWFHSRRHGGNIQCWLYKRVKFESKDGGRKRGEI
jgi:hypothetical protein